MDNINFSHDELQSILTQLEQALHNHLHWHNQIIRNIACRLRPDTHDVWKDAHKECQFGQWYYNYSPEPLRTHPGFMNLGEVHERMHMIAAQLLNDMSNKGTVDVHAYDNFANAVERMQLELNSLIRELETSLYTRDPLTGAINRVDMMPILRELYGMVSRQTIKCALVMVDLDNFKHINDTYGHQAGDTILTKSCKYLTENLRSYDKIFRFGGEEFLICLLQTDLQEARVRIDEVCTGLAALPVDIGVDKPIHITASFGLALLDAAYSLEQNLENVDKAMYSAKSDGRSCVREISDKEII